MKKIIYLFILLLPFPILALTYPTLHYRNALIYDLTDNTILYEYQSEEKTSIASLTKIITTIVAVESIDNLDETITYTKKMDSLVRWDASVAGLKVGDTITYRDLLYASILPSGADATTALALSLSGSIESFVFKMNELAQKLNMTNTHFVNVTGLDAEGHYSTAKDILTVLKYALANPTFKEIYTTKEYTLTNNLQVKSTVNNKNSNLDTSRIIGSKTGFTKEAGLCISALINSNNHDILIITIGAPTTKERYNITDALELITFLDNNYNNQLIKTKNDIIKTIPVNFSNISTYDITLKKDITYYLPNDYSKKDISIKYTGLEELSYYNKKDEQIGNIKIYYQDKLIYQEDIFLNENIKINILKILLYYKYFIITIVIFIIIIIIIIRKKRIKRLAK